MNTESNQVRKKGKIECTQLIAGLIFFFSSIELYGFVGSPGTNERNHYEATQKIPIEYINIKHLLVGQPTTKLDDVVFNSVILWLDKFMPLGILSSGGIAEIEEIFDQLKSSKSKQLPDKYFLYIPWIGSNTRDPIINENTRTIRLGRFHEIRDTINILKTNMNSGENPIDYFCREWLQKRLSLDQTIPKSQYEEEINGNIVEKMKHFDYTIFKIDSHEESGEILYHATYINYLIPILKKGLLINPNAHTTERNFGPGIYFTDSIQMCLERFNRLQYGIILVCRVKLGEIQEKNCQGDSEWEEGKNSFRYLNGAEREYIAKEEEQVEITHIIQLTKCAE